MGIVELSEVRWEGEGEISPENYKKEAQDRKGWREGN